MTCHVLHAGDGYTYLTRQVASADVERPAGESLADYYLAQGNPPGVWAGSGMAALGVSGQVSEEQMLALFGEGLHPEANRLIAAAIKAGRPYRRAVASVKLGRRFYQYDQPEVPLTGALKRAYAAFEAEQARRPSVAERHELKEKTAAALLRAAEGVEPAPERVRRYLVDELGRASQPVAGFDLVFTPAKSVSVLWGLGGREVRRVVERVHERAWRAAIAYGEREAGFTRIGRNGVAQIDTHGFVVAAFVHRDSRAGDPNLHTHAVVSNRVLGVDGQWRTLDSKALHRVAVSMSETYNAALEHGLSEQLGVDWVEVVQAGNKRPVREVAGVPRELVTGFSRRRSQVEVGLEALVADYTARYGHPPSRSVQRRLAQQATLAGRPGKEQLRSLEQQIAEWTATAGRLLPGQDIAAVLAAACHRVTPTAAAAVDAGEVAARVIAVVSAHRATWTVYHVRAEAIRQLKLLPFGSLEQRQAAVEAVTATALNAESIALSIAPPTPVPSLLQRADGESVFHRHGTTRYTSTAILDAEQRLLDAAATTAGPVVPAAAARAAIARHQQATGLTLDPGQQALVEQFVGCGRAVAVGIGPPGTGKSTAMRVVRQAWESTGGRVLGLAPSAAAASVLGDELGVRADTLHRLLAVHEHGVPDEGLQVRAGDMLLVDEAGMAGTARLDQLRALAAERGAVVRLLGDYRQLAAVEAGGVLRLLHHTHGGTELSTVHRFADPTEAAAVLAIRLGDTTPIPGFYTAHARVHGGPQAAMLDQLYRDWRADAAAGRAAIMMSDSAAIATELSARAQAERRATGQAEPAGVALRDGTTAGVGDQVVTRRNQRRLAVHGGADHVKNGDLWRVEARHDDGALTVRHLRHHGRVVLPAEYVAAHTELGYAATIHRCQGLTVDTARTFFTPLAVREAATVALSRGRVANHAYLDTEEILAADEPETLPGELFHRHRETSPPAAALAAIVRRTGAETSATEQLRDALATPHRLEVLVPQYEHALTVYRGPTAAAEAAGWVATALAGEQAAAVLDDPAWPALAEALWRVRDTGADPAVVLGARARQRPLDTDPADPARSLAQVLHHRLGPDLTRTTSDGGPAGLPGWVPLPPQPGPAEPREIAELGAWLRTQAAAIAARVHELGEAAAEHRPAWTQHLGPLPHDPVLRQAWCARAGQVAAYRERAGLPDDTELLPGSGHHEHARTWIQHYLAITSTSTATGELDRIHAAALRARHTSLRIEHLAATVARDQVRLAAAEQALAQFSAAHPDVVAAHREQAQRRQHERARERAAIAATIPQRPYFDLTDTALAAQLAREHAAAAEAARQHAHAQQQIADLGPRVAAGDGPAVRAVHDRLAEIARRAALARDHDQLAAQQQHLRTDAGVADAHAASQHWHAERMTRLDRVRHPGRHDRLRAEADQLREQAARARAEADQLTRPLAELVDQAGGDPAAFRRAQAEERLAVAHLERDLQQAHATDQRDLDRWAARARGHSTTGAEATARAGELTDEQQRRATQPAARTRAEHQLRTERAERRRVRDDQQHRGRHRHDDFYDHRHDHDLNHGHGFGLGR